MRTLEKHVPDAGPAGPAGLVRLFYCVFALCFTWLTAHIIVNGGWYYYGYKEVRLLVCVSLALGVLLCVGQLVKKYEPALKKHTGVITAVFLAVMAALQMALGAQLRYRPVFDLDAVYGGAVEWVETGSFSSYYDYYARFFNNFGVLRFLYLIFRLARGMGIHDYYLAATAVNCLLSVGTMFVTGLTARKLFGVYGQIMAYALFAVSPPFYFIAPAFYTDALSMPFPILTYWLYLLAKEQPRLRTRLLLYALMGGAVALGAQIKATVMIAFIAIAIDSVLTRPWRRTAAMTVVVAAVLLLGQAGLEHTIYQHLDRDQVEQERTPLLHWVMMGLTGTGMYNSADYAFTRSFADADEQDAALKAEIKDRLRDLGPDGLVRLLTVKGNICFGDGTYGLSDCLGGEPLSQTGQREWLLPGGAHNGAYRHICTGVLLALYALMILSAAQDAFSPRSGAVPLLVPRLAVFGLLLFLICWEARWRYFSNFVPLIFISALPGIDRVLGGPRSAPPSPPDHARMEGREA